MEADLALRRDGDKSTAGNWILVLSLGAQAAASRSASQLAIDAGRTALSQAKGCAQNQRLTAEERRIRLKNLEAKEYRPRNSKEA
jgi:hypothetical protein